MDSKLRELLQAALDKTNRGQLRWSAFSDESFRAAIGSGHLHLNRSWGPWTDDRGEEVSAETYFVQVSNGQGRVVVEGEAKEGVPQNGFELCRDLFRAARTAALGGYEVMDNMLRLLNRDS